MRQPTPTEGRNIHNETQLRHAAYRLQTALDETRRAISNAYEDGLSTQMIAAALNTTRQTVTRLRNDPARDAERAARATKKPT